MGGRRRQQKGNQHRGTIYIKANGAKALTRSAVRDQSSSDWNARPARRRGVNQGATIQPRLKRSDSISMGVSRGSFRRLMNSCSSRFKGSTAERAAIGYERSHLCFRWHSRLQGRKNLVANFQALPRGKTGFSVEPDATRAIVTAHQDTRFEVIFPDRLCAPRIRRAPQSLAAAIHTTGPSPAPRKNRARHRRRRGPAA